MKESLATKWIKHFFGIVGELDEQRKQVIGEISTKLFILTFYILMLQSAIILIFLLPEHPNTTLLGWGILGANFIYLMVISGYLMYRIEDAHLTDQDVEAEHYDLAVKQAKKSAFRKGIFLTILFPVIKTFFGIAQPHFNFLKELFTISNLVSGVLYGFLMWLFIRAMMISNIKK